MKEPMLKANLQFVVAFCDNFFNKHFKFLQKYDNIAKDYGYLCRHMALRTYIMNKDFDDISNWKEHKAFDLCRKTMEEAAAQYTGQAERTNGEPRVAADSENSSLFRTSIDLSMMHDAIDVFFKKAKDTLEKHFSAWVDDHLHFALVGERQCAEVMAQWLLEKDINSGTFNSEFHGTIANNGTPIPREIDLIKFIKFIDKSGIKERVKNSNTFKKHRRAIELIADGYDCWTL